MKKFSIFIQIIVVVISLLLSSWPAFAEEESGSAIDEPAMDQEKNSAPIAIKAINPGYTVDGVQNVGEFIELEKLVDESVLLTNYSIRYTNASGKSSSLFSFPAGSEFVGETLLLRLASAPEADQAEIRYTKTLAMSGGTVEIVNSDTVISQVCWTGTAPCLAIFKSTNPTTIVRDDKGEYSHVTNYSPAFNGESLNIKYAEGLIEDLLFEPQCFELKLSELMSYYSVSSSEQFIELYNPTDHRVSLEGCMLGYKNKYYSLSGEIKQKQYLAFYVEDIGFKLTKQPTTENVLDFIDANGELIEYLTYDKTQKINTSLALFDNEWKITYNITPGKMNIFQEFRACEAGKIINPTTGNCIKIQEEPQVKKCPEGKILNPETNRCKNKEVSKVLTACPAGKYRNPLTGRCKNREENKTAKECAAGYERNPETNRCRKIKKNTGASYSVAPTGYSESRTFTGYIVVGALIVVGIGYIVFQYRRELKVILLRLFQRLRKMLRLNGGK